MRVCVRVCCVCAFACNFFFPNVEREMHRSRLRSCFRAVVWCDCFVALESIGVGVACQVDESVNSLNFATRVRAVELGQAKKKTESAEVSALKKKLKELESKS